MLCSNPSRLPRRLTRSFWSIEDCVHRRGIPGALVLIRPVQFFRVVSYLLAWCLILSLGSQLARAQLSSSQQEELAAYFGFGEMEIYKIDEDISNLLSSDMNGDGLSDFIVVNNRKSEIDVFLQRTEIPDQGTGLLSSDVNELESHWRFEKKPIPVNYRVSSMALAELTGDSAVDIVFFGEPEELVLLENKGDGTFAAPTIQRVRDGISRKRALGTGDLNGDGLADVALLGEKDVIFFYQRKSGGLSKPVYEAHAANQPFTLDLADINGDGLDDLIIMTGGSQYHANVRLQTNSGQLGPQLRIKIPKIRTWEFLHCNDNSQADMIGVEYVSGRLRRWQFVVSDEHTGIKEWPVLFFPYPAGAESSSRPVAIGDVDGDGNDDLVTVDVKAAQLLFYQQQQGAGLKSPVKFGGQVNMRDIRTYDLDSDQKCDVLVCSADEKAIGISHWAGGRLTFPVPVPTIAEPQAFDLAQAGNEWHLFVYVTKEEGDYFLMSQLIKGMFTKGEFECTVKENPQKVAIENFSTEPSAVRVVDINQDGYMDVLVFAPYEPLVTFLQTAEGSFERLSGGSSQEGLVKKATIEGFQIADVTRDGKPEILLAQHSFARALRVNEKKQWVVVDQYNAPTASSEITGVAVFGVAAGRYPNIALYDQSNGEIHWLKPQKEGAYDVEMSFSIGTFELKAMLTAQISGFQETEVFLTDSRKFALVQPGLPTMKAVEKTYYESKTKDAKLRRPAVGDLNHDGRADIALTETSEHQIEILTFGPQGELVLASSFKVFATKQLFQTEEDAGEPRTILIRDLNNDGHDDLAIIVHDRVIIFPSE